MREAMAEEEIAHDQALRRRWMGVVARADEATLARLMHEAGADAPYDVLRGPEEGLVMLRGRMGGDGGPFSLGEMTVTRCSLRLACGAVGHAATQGRRPAHALRAALMDALMQDPARRAGLEAAVIVPLEAAEQALRAKRAADAAATRVEFFTLARGEDA
jgi:alpha-D-ribose 1-methylphosphonate 5-triphosphate synthase subunit PhnG